jgi:phosphoribosylanthranilate isomerase
MTKIKICGITRAEDAALAIELGADYLGFVFVPESPRYVTPERAMECGGNASAFQRVGVFRNAQPEEILRSIEVAKLDMVQIHAERRAGFSPPPGVHVIQAFNVQTTLPDTNTRADYILFDTGGGTGRVFDWDLLAGYDRTKPFFLAGGITPDNVAEAIGKTNPYAIDVASGVEDRPGVKDHGKLRALFEAIHK